MSVRDVMTTSVISVQTDTPLKQVASMLVEHGISGLPVVDAERRVVGVVSETDLVLKETGVDAVPHRALERLRGESKATRSYRSKLGATTASEAMTAPAITIRASRSLAEAARLMTRHGINRLVVEDDSQIVGIVTRADLVRAYVRSDDELADTIRKEVLWRSMWLDPAGFTVNVRQGIAHIRGHVDRRSMADLVKHSVAMVPGIVDVSADVTWAFDDSQVQAATIDPHFPFSTR